MHVAQESYGRIACMLAKKVPVTLALDMENRFFPQNTSSGDLYASEPR